MLRFFRTIRQRLLTENRFSRYLLYAIGEILLVVIGILIALQIDNLNEKRKIDEQEKQLLRELVHNLESNLTVLEVSNEKSRETIRGANAILEHFENGKKVDSLEKLFFASVYMKTLNLSYATFETIKNIGFDLIKDDDLRLEIIDLFEISYANRITSMKDVGPAFFQQYLNWGMQRRDKLEDILYSIDNGNDRDLTFVKNYLMIKKNWERDGIKINIRLIHETIDLKKRIQAYLDKKG